MGQTDTNALPWVEGEIPTGIALAGLDDLQDVVNEAGLAGYDFSNTTQLVTDLNRLRRYLWPRRLNASGAINPWAFVSDPVLPLGANFLETNHLQVNGGADRIDRIFPAGTVDQLSCVMVARLPTSATYDLGGGDIGVSVPPKFGGVLRYEFPTYQVEGGDERWDIQHNITRISQNPKYRITSITVDYYFTVTGGAFTSGASFRNGEVIPGSVTPGVPGIQVVNNGLIRGSFLYSISGTGVAAWRNSHILDLPWEWLSIPPGHTITSCRRLITASFNCDVMASIGNEMGGDEARVIDPSRPNWSRLRAASMRIVRSDGYRPLITDDVLARFGGTFPTRGYWRYRRTPVSEFRVPYALSRAEGWKTSHLDYNGFIPSRGNYSAGALGNTAADAPIARVVAPHAPSIDTRLYDEPVRAAAGWPDYDAIEVTVPAVLTVEAGPLALPAYRFGTDTAFPVLNPDLVSYFKIPLPGVTQEQELDAVWDVNKATKAEAKGYTGTNFGGPRAEFDGTRANPMARGTQATEYFHDARLLSLDGNRFWHRDSFRQFADDVTVAGQSNFRRFPHWVILPDGAGWALYLITAYHVITTGYDGLGAPIQDTRTFTPVNGITPAMFRDSFLEINRGSQSGLYVGNVPDFQPPYCVFSATDPKWPIAAWTVDRTIGGVWNPGEKIVLHLPRAIARTPCYDFHYLKNQALEDGYQQQQILAAQLPVGSRRTEIHDVEVWRSDRHAGPLVFRNGSATLRLTPPAVAPTPDFYVPVPYAADLRIYKALQSDSAGGRVAYNGVPVGYELETEPAYRDLGFVRGSPLNPGQFSYDRSSGTITLLDSTLGTDEWLVAWVEFQKVGGATPAITLDFGTLHGGGYPFTFTPWKTVLIPYYAKTPGAAFYLNVVDGTNDSTEPRWILDKAWYLVFRKQFGYVGANFSSAATSYTVNGLTFDGVIGEVDTLEDITVRYRAGWRTATAQTYAQWKAAVPSTIYGGVTAVGNELRSLTTVWGSQKQYVLRFKNSAGVAYTPSFTGSLVLTISGIEPADTDTVTGERDFYAITETDFFEGHHYVPPYSLNAYSAARVERICYFEPAAGNVLANPRQRFEVRTAWRELWDVADYPYQYASDDPVVSQNIVGLPFAAHVNETRRLLRAWIDAGKP